MSNRFFPLCHASNRLFKRCVMFGDPVSIGVFCRNRSVSWTRLTISVNWVFSTSGTRLQVVCTFCHLLK